LEQNARRQGFPEFASNAFVAPLMAPQNILPGKDTSIRHQKKGYIWHSQIYIYALSLSVLGVKRFHNVRKRTGMCSGIFTSPKVR
jgi:hypothetical protein